jgi:hypothetical protein
VTESLDSHLATVLKEQRVDAVEIGRLALLYPSTDFQLPAESVVYSDLMEFIKTDAPVAIMTASNAAMGAVDLVGELTPVVRDEYTTVILRDNIEDRVITVVYRKSTEKACFELVSAREADEEVCHLLRLDDRHDAAFIAHRNVSDVSVDKESVSPSEVQLPGYTVEKYFTSNIKEYELDDEQFQGVRLRLTESPDEYLVQIVPATAETTQNELITACIHYLNLK